MKNLSSSKEIKETSKDIFDTEQIWSHVLSNLEKTINSNSFSTWFSSTYLMRVKDNIAYIGVPNEFARQWIQDKYLKALIKEIRDILGDNLLSVKIVISNRPTSKVRKKKIELNTDKKDGTSSYELPFDQIQVNRENNLNPRYNFESYIVCPFNQLVHAAALSVVQNPGIAYNPFFVYGTTGCGKTHIMQAIGNTVKESGNASKIMYATSESFSSSYLNAISKNTILEFKERFRSVDVLLIDDVQFFSTKEKTQEEFFHTINTLIDSNKQVCFSSDSHPEAIEGIAPRLISRFCAGIVVNLPQPDFESRINILNNKFESCGYEVDNSVVSHIAKEIKTNVRQLEGLVNRITIEMKHKGLKPSVDNIGTILKEFMRPKGSVSHDEVIKKVCNFYKLTEESILSSVRQKNVVKARQIIMYILRDRANSPYSLIGKKLRRDHTTVMHSCDKVKTEYDKDAVLRYEVDSIVQILNLD